MNIDQKKDKAREIMSRIRYQIFRPEVTTVCACVHCGADSRGGLCADCITERELSPIVGPGVALNYVTTCRAQRAAECRVIDHAAEARDK